MNQLLTQLETLRNIPDSKRWPGALWPDDKAFKDARKFISGLPLALIPNPEIRLADDGEINFLWQNEDIHIDLGFYGTEPILASPTLKTARKFPWTMFR